MNNSIPNDELTELIEKAGSGDLRAFERIVRTYQRYGLAVSFRILCDEDDAKDVVQESFIKIWKNLKSYDSKFKFTTWMYKIVVNLCYDKLKARKRTNAFSGKRFDEISSAEIVSSADLEKEFTNRETALLIKYFSKGLSERQRIIFVLRDIEGLSIGETAAITGVSESAVKTNLFFARQNIRKKMGDYENETGMY